MKTLFLDVMLNDRFVCTLKYKFCPLFPIELDDLKKFIESKRPSLKVGCSKSINFSTRFLHRNTS